MRRILPILLAVVLLLALTSCAGEGTAGSSSPEAVPGGTAPGGVGEANSSATPSSALPSPVTFTDDLDREVTVEDPRRVATLLGSFAQVWYLAGGTVCASADDAWEDFSLPLPEDAVNLGKLNEPSLEKLFAAKPDLVLASSKLSAHLELQETLEQAGIAAAYFDVSDFDDYLRLLKVCTQITGREDLYEENGLRVQAQIDQALAHSKQRLQGKTPPKVLSMRASASYIRAKNSKGNVLGEMLKSLGCENIADSDESLLENLSLERILEEDPKWIFIVQTGDDAAGTEENLDRFFAENPAWGELTAVKEGRVRYLEKELYNLKPNDRWGEAYEKLEDILSEE